MAKPVEEGKVCYLATTLRCAHTVHPIAAVQLEYSPLYLNIEKIDSLKTTRELGIAIIAYFPLGRAMLTGAYKSHDDIPDGDWRKTVPKFSPSNFPKIITLANSLQKIGYQHKATAGQVTLVWLLAQGNDIIPISWTKEIKYLTENVGAFDIRLSNSEVKKIRELAESTDVHLGDRCPPGSMELLYSDTPEL